MMKSSLVTQTLLLLLGLQAHNVAAGPTGASACPGGIAAVGGAHLAEGAVTGALADSPALLRVVLDDEQVLTTDTPTPFSVGVDHKLSLTRNESPYFFKGFLFRLDNPDANNGTMVDTTMAFALDPDAKEAEAKVQVATTVCVDSAEGVGGLTHVDNTDKTSVTGILRLDEAASGLPLDVTCVIRNSNGESEYYYSRYFLNAVAGEDTPEEEAEEEQVPEEEIPDAGEAEEESPEAEPDADAEEVAPEVAPDASEEEEEAPEATPAPASSANARLVFLALGLVTICSLMEVF